MVRDESMNNIPSLIVIGGFPGSGKTTMSGRRVAIAGPRPPQNRACGFHRTRLKQIAKHQQFSLCGLAGGKCCGVVRDYDFCPFLHPFSAFCDV